MAMVWFLSRGMTSPLREMARATSEMAKGNYDRRVSTSSRDEVGELARAFNQMAAELAETDRVRRDLVANVSHELRTPITALQAVLENLVDGVTDPDPETFQHDARPGRAARPAGQAAPRPLPPRVRRRAARPHRRSAVEPLLEHAVREQQLHAPEIAVSRVGRLPRPHRRRRPRARAPGGRQPARERGAPHPARRLGRGAGATPRHRRHHRGARRGPRHRRGRRSARVFERFYRADSARASTDGGAGLGLAIAQWIVDLHGGDIHPERRDPHGCRMVVTLPTPIRHHPTDPNLEERHRCRSPRSTKP